MSKYKTTILWQSAALMALGADDPKIEILPDGNWIFVFDKTPELELAVNQWNERSLEVNIYEFNQHYKKLNKEARAVGGELQYLKHEAKKEGGDE